MCFAAVSSAQCIRGVQQRISFDHKSRFKYHSHIEASMLDGQCFLYG